MNNWTVLLIGGASGVGKSHLGRQLSHHYKVPLVEVDDIRIALRTVADKDNYPDLFTFVDNPNFLDEFSQEQFVAKLIDVGVALWPALDVLISKHIKCNEPVIIEGDGIIPKMLAGRSQDEVQSLFLDDEIDSIRSKIEVRNRHGSEIRKLDRRSEFAHAYNEEIIKQAREHDFQVVSASPMDTLLERVVSGISIESQS